MDGRSLSSWCRITGAGKLPAELGGADAVCAAIGGPLSQVQQKPAMVEVTVLSPFLLRATVTAADGRRLPPFAVGSSDRTLSPRSLRMLGEVIAARLDREMERR